MPRADKIRRWTQPEIIDILKYLNDNFDSWYENRNAACAKAVEFANIDRDPKAVYNKVHTMIKTLEEYNKTKKKPNDPIWEDKKVLNLLKKICDRSTERKEEEKEEKREQSEDTIKLETTSNTDQEKPKLWHERMDTDEDVIDIERDDKLKLFNAKLREYQELPTQLKQLRSELKEMQERINEKEERFKTLREIFEDD